MNKILILLLYLIASCKSYTCSVANKRNPYKLVVNNKVFDIDFVKYSDSSYRYEFPKRDTVSISNLSKIVVDTIWGNNKNEIVKIDSIHNRCINSLDTVYSAQLIDVLLMKGQESIREVRMVIEVFTDSINDWNVLHNYDDFKETINYYTSKRTKVVFRLSGIRFMENGISYSMGGSFCTIYIRND